MKREKHKRKTWVTSLQCTVEFVSNGSKGADAGAGAGAGACTFDRGSNPNGSNAFGGFVRKK